MSRFAWLVLALVIWPPLRAEDDAKKSTIGAIERLDTAVAVLHESPDEKTLYVANSDPHKAIWMSFPINQDGTLGKGKVFADYTTTVGKKGKTADGQPAMQLPDGLKVDVKGNLWATGPGGLLVFTPAGKHLGTLATGVNTGNCCFGDDGSTLYVMCDHAIARIKTKTKGLGF